MMVDGLVRFLEICFVWCQTLAFLHLSYQLKKSSQQSGSETENSDHKVERFFKGILVVGIAFF